MKKLVFGLLSLFLVVGSINAQEGKKALKKASKLLAEYGKNAVANGDKLSMGMELLETAMQSDEVAKDPKSLVAVGQAYNAVVNGQINTRLLDPTFEITNADASLKAYDMLFSAYEMAEKKGDKKKALAGLVETEGILNNIAITYFQGKDYASAFDYFQKGVDLYKKASTFDGFKSRLDDELVRKDHYFYTGASGYYGKKGLAAAPVLEELAGDITAEDQPLIFEALYSIYSESDPAKAVGFLEKGRAMFPDDSGLLFAEINKYLIEGKLDVLLDKLKLAQEKEPENGSIITTLGNVNDQISNKKREAGEIEEADKYFDEALKYYNMALEMDPSNFDAQYSMGALYYNKAASLAAPINELANDFSPEGSKKYDMMKAEMDSYFDQAKPLFEKAAVMNPSDLNTLIALREIAARDSDFDKVAEYKAKIEQLQSGGGN